MQGDIEKLPVYNIAMAANDGYAQHLGVCLVSLFENNQNRRFMLYLFSDNISRTNIDKIKEVCDRYGNHLNVITPKREEFAGLPIRSYYSLSTYYRLRLADYLDESVKRILYLDADMTVVADIGELLDTDLEDFPIAAVNDTPWQLRYAVDHIGGTVEGNYFNAGMMLIDVDRYRSYQIFSRAVQILNDKKYKCDFLDQDVLNIIFRNNWKELPCKWNLLNGFLKREYMTDARWEDILDGIRHRAIVHYSAEEKPWSWRCQNPLKKEYFKYLALSPWSSFKVKRSLRQKLACIKNQVYLFLGLRERVYISLAEYK